MSDTLYERYNAGDDGVITTYGASWKAQTFTVGNTGANVNHSITSVKLKLYRVGLPGTITVSIRSVDGDSKPTGGDLTSGTTNGDTLTTNTAGEWREISLISYGLSSDTMYAIVIRAVEGSADNLLRIRIDNSSPTYTGGVRQYSANSGVSWSLSSSDALFEEYGTIGGSSLVITTYNGCTSSGATSVAVTAALTSSSGNTQIYYGTTNEGEVKSAWHYSSSKLLKYNGNNWSVLIPVAGDTTSFLPSTQYYYISYASSNAWGVGEDWAPATIGFKTKSAEWAWISSMGCTASSNSTATLSSKVRNASGTVWYAWAQSDKGTSLASWSPSTSKQTGIKLSGNTLSYQATSLPSDTSMVYRTYISSNWWNGTLTSDWSDVVSFRTGTTPGITSCSKDLKIYYLSLTGNDFICCNCSRWDTNNYSIVIETWLTKSDLQILRDNITPGAVGELYKILGEPTYYDKTWEGRNTIMLIPQDTSQGTLSNMRGEKVCFPKTITTSTMKGDDGWIMCKIEAYISGNQNL